MEKYVFLFTMLLFCGSLFAQEEVTLRNGKTIIVCPDGTWKIKKVISTNSTFTDPRDGHVYKTVTIGTQTWMAENLAYRMNNGCWTYNNNQTYVAIYGYYYDWESAKKACPPGWHLPSEAEWNTLIKSLGGSGIAGDKLKEAGNKSWVSDPNCNATNSSGFTALPGGCRYYNGDFSVTGCTASWWSNTLVKGEISNGPASIPDGIKAPLVTAYDSGVGFNIDSLDDGKNIRCIKN